MKISYLETCEIREKQKKLFQYDVCFLMNAQISFNN